MAYDYLKPKASRSAKIPQRKNGMFMNQPPYPQLGGFSGSSMVPGQDPPMTVDKSPTARTGRPI